MATDAIGIRCYCHGLGDAMLLSLPRRDGADPQQRDDWYFILIDCGIHSATKGGTAKMRAVVDDILERTQKRIDVIVGTHEHWDHLSGFLQAEAAFRDPEVKIGEIWFSWAEDPANHQARKLDRFKGDAAMALSSAAMRLAGDETMMGLAEGIDGVLGFVFGAKGEKVRDARETLRGLGGTVRHLEPGTLAPLPRELGVRAYVLGPPHDTELLDIEDVISETYALGSGSLAAAPLANGLALGEGLLDVDDDPAAPFDGSVGLDLAELMAGRWAEDDPLSHKPREKDPYAVAHFWNHYLADRSPTDALSQGWRRIGHDWLGHSAELALQLDARTNNTSLVLAFEIAATGRVLLFAADAQIGNWRSWPTVTFAQSRDGRAVSGEDLIERTVFYKVGHHGSRNATRTESMEKMDRSMLVAFSPTSEKDASKVGWSDFPAPKLNARLQQITSGRFIQSDAAWLTDPEADCPIPTTGALRRIEKHPDGLYVDLLIG